MTNRKDYLRARIHKTGLAGQHKHDAILDQLFNGAPTDPQHLLHAHALINSYRADAETKRYLWESLIHYTSTGDKDAAKRGIYAYGYVQAVSALDKALKPILRADRSILDVFYQIQKLITVLVNYIAVIANLTSNNHLIPSSFRDSLLTKTMPAHAPTSVIRDAA